MLDHPTKAFQSSYTVPVRPPSYFAAKSRPIHRVSGPVVYDTVQATMQITCGHKLVFLDLLLLATPGFKQPTSKERKEMPVNLDFLYRACSMCIGLAELTFRYRCTPCWVSCSFW
jgi:hypothetical protein